VLKLRNSDIKKTIQIIRNYFTEVLTNKLFGRFLDDLGPGGIAIDCGANVGDISERMAKTGVRVYAFEPNPHAFQILKKRLENFENVTCINKGVWDRNTSTKLYLHKEASKDEEFWSFASSIIKEKINVDPGCSVEIQLVDLCEFIENLDQPVDLLKMDIEGAEYEILEKFLEKYLHHKVKMTLVETHDSKIKGLKEKSSRIRKIIKNKGIKNVKLSWL
jgi:FkbM family methyltransferase